MNTRISIRCLACLLICLWHLPEAFGQAEVTPNKIKGVMRWSNADPAILDLLDPPGNKGMSNLYVTAYSPGPSPRSATSDLVPADSRTSTTYELSVDSNADGISYVISPRVSMLGETATYFFNNRTSPPVVAFAAGPTLDFEECLSVLTVRFVTADGTSVAVDGGDIHAVDVATASDMVILNTIASGATEQQVFLRGDAEALVTVTLLKGLSTFTDRIHYTAATNVTVPCDSFATVDIVVPAAGDLSEVTGNVDMLGEFELTIDGYEPGDYPDPTSVVARFGPFGNVRYASVPGVNFTVPSSGDYKLANLLASTLDPTSPGYVVSAEMYIRRGEALQYFRTPALGDGANPALVVEPGVSLSLSNLFTIDPGFMRGSILLQGPSESLGRSSLLRGMAFAYQDDKDADGVPDSLGTYGVYSSTVAALGVDRLAAGANFTASYGYGYSGFKGTFNPASSAYEANYELALGGLLSEPSLWKRTSLTVNTTSEPGVDDRDYYSSTFTITDTSAPEVEIDPAQAVTQDVAYCLSEVCISFRSTEPFYNPNIRFSSGGFTNTDFQGHEASYSVYVDPAFGAPTTEAAASTTGQVLLYLPEGSYRLTPYIQPSNSLYATVSGDPIDLKVGCGQRICIDRRLQLNATLPTCALDGSAHVTGTINSFNSQVTKVSWQIDDGEPAVVCENCGISPSFDFSVAVPAGVHRLTVRAEDETGGFSSITGSIGVDTLPPTIACPQDLTLEATQPCGATLDLNVTATDNCDSAPVVVCTPALNSTFPLGTTAVNCVATDASGNSAQCMFSVTVTPGTLFSRPTISSVSPALVGLQGGGSIQVLGTGFTVSDEVLIDGVALQNPVWVTSTELDGKAPPLSTGAHEVQIRRCGEIVARLADACQSTELPKILSIDPAKCFANGGNSVIVRGTNFLATTQVRFGFAAPGGTENLLRNSTVSSDGTTITGHTPALSPGELFGPRDVIVEDSRGRDVLAAAITYIPNELETDPQVVAYRQFERDTQTPAELRIRNGFPISLSGRVPVAGDSNPARAVAFLNRYRDLFRLANPEAELVAASSEGDDMQNVRLRQSYRGMDIIGAELSIMISEGNVLDAIGGVLPTEFLLPLNTTPTLSSEDALARAREVLGLPEGLPTEAPKLSIFDRCLLQTALSEPHLVWSVSLEGAAEELLVDAHTGETVFRNALERQHGGDLNGFDLDLRDAINTFTPTNTPACYGSPQVLVAGDENGMAIGYGNDNNATTARMHLQNAYRFFHSNFDWHSYNNDSAQLRVFVHSAVANASWSPSCSVMSIRDGWVDFEVILHEMTHGVVASTSKLRYFLESGALDESYADVMAVLADRQSGDLNWTVGENRIGSAGVVRDIPNNAVRFWGQFNPGDGTATLANDFGNVHSNSGIPNYVAYLMATRNRLQGATTLLPLTEAKLVQLKFAALRSLTTDSTFMAARTREITIASEWARTGKFGFSSPDITIVRLAWADVGVGDELDSDRDGIPDHDDNCRYRANPKQTDADGDGVGDVCDNCMNTFNPHQEDLDNDGIGDVCDDDMDGDGCRNSVDQHPASAVARSGTFFSATCNPKTGAVYTFEGVDHDGDGLRDCEDLDDDGDGIPDDLDPCPLVFGANPNGCRELRDCPLIGKDWPFICAFGGCNEFELRFRDRINPDPTRTVVFDHVQVVNETLYFQPSLGNTIQQVSRAIAPQLGARRLADVNESGWRVEIWTHSVDGQAAHLVAVVGDYDPSTLSLDQIKSGSMLAFSPAKDGVPATLASVWHTAADPATTDEDSDHDGMPDGFELRYGLNPHNPLDAALDLDRDGVSNLDEYLANTDPSDASNVFRILRTTATAQQSVVEFVGPAGRHFQLDYTASLSNPQWVPVGDSAYGTGGLITVQHNRTLVDSQGFYRLRLLEE